MPANFLEQLVTEWYEYKGYFIKRNVWVGRRPQGGYECELDVVAFDPISKHLVHIEPSTDASSGRNYWHLSMSLSSRGCGGQKMRLLRTPRTQMR
jgi:hypothetical protein